MKLYTKKKQLSRDLEHFLHENQIKMSKPFKKLFVEITLALILGESTVSSDIARYLKQNIKNDSIRKKLYRFFNNSTFDYKLFYEEFIKSVINQLRLRHNRAFLTMDHSFERNEFATIMITLKVGSQGIPIYFRNAKTKEFCKTQKELDERIPVFSEEELSKAITTVASYFDSKNSELIFLADRWFLNLNLLKLIDKLGHKYVFRIKKESSLKIQIPGSKDESVWKNINSIKPKIHSGKYLQDIIFGKSSKMKANLVIAMEKKTNDPWYLITNAEVSSAVFYYSHRFGAIECLFKNTKSNGFRLEKSRIKNIRAFDTLYTVVCFSVVFINSVASDYINSYNSYKKKLDIKFCRYNKNNKCVRILSNFKLGLTIIKSILFDYENDLDFKIKTNFRILI